MKIEISKGPDSPGIWNLETRDLNLTRTCELFSNQNLRQILSVHLSVPLKYLQCLMTRNGDHQYRTHGFLEEPLGGLVADHRKPPCPIKNSFTLEHSCCFSIPHVFFLEIRSRPDSPPLPARRWRSTKRSPRR